MPKRRQQRTVSVKLSDIQNGVQSDAKGCTIQIASVRAFPDAEEITISNGLMHVRFDDAEWVYEIPHAAVCIPILIDEGKRDKVEPLDFVVNHPHIKPLKRKRKPCKSVNVRQHTRVMPGEGDTHVYANAGVEKSAIQRSAAARMRNELRLHFASKPNANRFQGLHI